MGNDVKTKLNDQIRLVVRLHQLEEERKLLALSSARDSQSVIGERDALRAKVEEAEREIRRREEEYRGEVERKTQEID